MIDFTKTKQKIFSESLRSATRDQIQVILKEFTQDLLEFEKTNGGYPANTMMKTALWMQFEFMYH